ncbi:MAG: copper chaperone PCu(A)C [Gammaproteobacteria bacterium]|nr:copper chaperone PCu(A)C [Gammaproteobacteria bacterium]
MKCLSACLLTVLLLAACSEPGPALLVEGLQVTAPLPGRAVSTAYMSISNSSTAPIVIEKFTSPEFARVEIHRTSLVDGVASMSRLESLAIPANDQVTLASGGLHLMLLEPEKGLIPGQTVTLELHFNGGGLLIINAPLASRQPTTGGEV